jgi:hypothetical protein
MTVVKRLLFSAVLIAAIPVLTLIIGELVVRVILYVKYSRNTGSSMLVLDDVLGWRVAPGFVFRGDVTDKSGNQYKVSITVDEAGCRWVRAGNSSNSPCIFFVGDSFTMAVDASDEKTYYAWIAKVLKANAVAIGGGGYGTCQEFLVLDRFLDRIRPDMVVLQLCDNDFINNSCELESLSTRNNNSMRRPYLDESGHLFYAMPGGYPRIFPRLRMLVNRHSRFLYFVFSRIDRCRSASGDSVEDVIVQKGRDFPLYNQAVRVTAVALEMIRQRVPKDIPVVAFCAGDCDELRSLCRKTGIQFIDGVSETLARAEQTGHSVRAADGAHWNETGHKIVGEYLAIKIDEFGVRRRSRL